EAPSQESEAAKSRALAPAAAAGAAPGSAAVPVTQAGEKGASRAASVSAKATSKKAKAAEAAEAAVQEYLAFHNRPFSEKDVVANLRSADATKHVQKVAVSSALNRLVQGGTATKKDFGKTSLFFSTQPQTPVDTASIYAAVVVETPKAVLQLSKTEAKIRKVEKRTEKLEAEPSNGDLDVRLDGARHAK
ncbi:Tat binding protein 1-interacting protein-domain-containing protein, partial [Pelagophyceae sp. CCMP2097]